MSAVECFVLVRIRLLFFFKNECFKHAGCYVLLSVRESRVRDACRAVEAEVVGSAVSLSFWFALGLASPRLFPTQMSSVFSARSSVPEEKNCQTLWPG